MEEFRKQLAELQAKITGKKPADANAPQFSINRTFEINLVPEIKYQMLKSMRFRNITLFVCIIVVAAFGAGTLVFGSIVGGQAVVQGNQDAQLEKMAKKVSEFGSMDEFLTLQNQLDGIQVINDNKKMLSRIFSVMASLLPTNGDEVTLSKASINMEDNTITVEGQANAGVAPDIDYRVLEAFKKGAEMTKYDFGRYVDAEGNEIPSRCMIEARTDGTTFMESDGSIYAYQTLGKYGCDVNWKARKDELDEWAEEAKYDENLTEDDYQKRVMEIYNTYKSTAKKNWYDRWLDENHLERYDSLNDRYGEIQAAYIAWYNGLSDEEKEVVDVEIQDGVAIQDVEIRKIYRTPQFTDWLSEKWTDEDGKSREGTARMDMSGSISNWPHFESECVSYSGVDAVVDGKEVVRWTTTNDCMMLAEEMNVLDSTNGKDSEEKLVLRFRALITIDENVLLFGNKHMLMIGPDGQNVTDSYLQIQGMFEQEAQDCNAAGVICTESSNTGGSQ